MYRENFPERIKKARDDAGFSQEYVCAECKIPQSTLSKYESGKLEPDLEKLAKLADFLNVSTDWLLGLGRQERQERQ
jgi:Predicted transcription factor, homolog of eukaryotic MBF1